MAHGRYRHRFPRRGHRRGPGRGPASPGWADALVDFLVSRWRRWFGPGRTPPPLPPYAAWQGVPQQPPPTAQHGGAVPRPPQPQAQPQPQPSPYRGRLAPVPPRADSSPGPCPSYVKWPAASPDPRLDDRPILADMPFRRRPHLLSKGERAFWHPLYLAVKGRYRLAFKVRLADVVHVPESADPRGYWFKKVRGYHVDFVLCDPDTTAPLLVVELDDRSHASDRGTRRDRFKDAVLAAGGVPVYRVRAQQAYDPKELADEISRRLG